MRKLLPIMILSILALCVTTYAQEMVIPLPQGEGYAIKKEAPTPQTRWQLMLVNPGGPNMPSSERALLSPSSFYRYNLPPDMQEQEFDPTAEDQAVMDAEYFKKLEKVPIDRLIKPEDEGDIKDQLDAFLDAYNQMLRQPQLSQQPIEYVIEWAVWQYWYNQASLWEQYVNKEIFLRKNYESGVEKLDFTNRDALNSSLAGVAQEINEEARRISEEEHQQNLRFLHRLNLRENRRADYKQWLKDQKEMVVDFAREWQSRVEGRKVSIDGAMYLLSEEPMESVPTDAVNLVTDKITPYDLLNADGTLKKPSN